ncbi:NUDIX domain-containing protein [Rudaeicoccus suwonensis]|uniref:ADP-ribose pyrophosphatase n=1 Tax=Rudaeicoccus suwonensis TaxID=657409 RepID=A0A561EA42_9MICO|nr:NUDIX hydrolase [Rudaeicoccus suwonensis]TWE12486.1 ADP-ribose pyrophosphatase [Rudaeicoccus suwonensis]
MSGTHPVLPADIADRLAPQHVTSSQLAYHGRVWDVVTDDVDLGEAGHVTRDYVRHTGAVAVLALRGEPGAEEVVLIQQYRHPVGTFDWEIPAGLLDIAGEDPRDAAARELREEADLDAHEWHVLLDLFTSPGASSENLRVFLARDVFPATADGFDREGEEADMPTGWISLDDAVTAALEGRLHNGIAVASVLAGSVARQQNWSSLRPADVPWPEHPAYR